VNSDKHLALHEQTTQLAQQAGAHREEPSITNHVTPPNAEGQQHRISVTSDPGYETVDIQVTPASDNPSRPSLHRPDVHVTTVHAPDTTGFSADVRTSAGVYGAASNQRDESSAHVFREGYGMVELKNPKAADLIASLAVKEAGRAIDVVAPAKTRPKQGLLKRALTRS
jgi:hypothetical protein